MPYFPFFISFCCAVKPFILRTCIQSKEAAEAHANNHKIFTVSYFE